MYLQAIDQSSPSFVGLRAWPHKDPPGPEDHDIVGASLDSLYWYAWVGLRTGPWVLTVPPISPSERYDTSQWNDMTGNIIGNVSALGDGHQGGNYLLAPPGWDAPVPAGIIRALQSESYLVGTLTRTELLAEDDLEDVHRLQRGYRLQPLSSFGRAGAGGGRPGRVVPFDDEDLYYAPTSASMTRWRSCRASTAPTRWMR